MTVQIPLSLIESIVNRVGLDNEDAIRYDYSGRGMYGDTCLGIVVSTPGDLIAFTNAVTNENRDNIEDSADSDEARALSEFVRWIEDVSSDSMGYDTIYYWRNVQVTGTEQAEEMKRLQEEEDEAQYLADLAEEGIED